MYRRIGAGLPWVGQPLPGERPSLASAPMAAPSQRRALGTLFLVLCIGFAGVAYAATVAGVWAIGVAAGLLALWFASLSWHSLRRN